MKITNIAIVFIIIILPFVVMSNIQSRSMTQGLYTKLQIDSIVDTAVEDAVSVMVERGDNHQIIINKDMAIQTFYNTVFANFNVISDPIKQKQLMGYIPVIMIIDYEGCYRLAQDKFLMGDELAIPEWYPMKPYAYMDNKFIYSFTLDDYLTIINIDSGECYEGYRDELSKIYNTPILSDASTFDEIRRRTIIMTIENDVSYGINNHNKIAEQYGINYEFTLPVIEEADWYHTINHIGMIAFFQGIPIGLVGEYYNNYAIGGAMVIKESGYYIEEDRNTGILYYHQEDCSHLVNKDFMVKSREECAGEYGAFPCEVCKP